MSLPIDYEDYICLNWVEGACPYRCSWNDCGDFKPSSYMKSFIEQIKKEVGK